MNQNTSIIKQNDSLVSEIVKRRDPFCRLNIPEHCAGVTSDPAHVFGRTNMATRWELLAVYGGCRPCHSFIDTHLKKKKSKFMELMGYTLYRKLDLKSKTTVKYLPSDLWGIRKALQDELKL